MQLRKSTIEKALKKPLRIAGYLRVSTKEQAQEGDSIPAQRDFIQRKVESWKTSIENAIESLTFFEEEGRSGKNLKRPEILRLQQAIQRGEIDALVIVKLDRLSRNTDDFRVIEKLLDKHQVDLYPLNDFYDMSNAQGWYMRHMTVGNAEYERRVTSERTKLAMDYRAKRGMWNGGYIFGYRKDHESEKLLVHSEEAGIIRNHFYVQFEKLGSVGRVQKHLQNHGIMFEKHQKNGTLSKKSFSKAQIRRVLENDVYLGHIVWGKVRTENAHPPIVTIEQAKRVRRQLNQNRQRKTNTRYSRGRQYPLKNLVRCVCGHHMTPAGAIGRNEKYYYYECTLRNHRGKASCSQPAIPAVALEDAVFARVRQLGTSKEARKQITDTALNCLRSDYQRLKEKAGLINQRMSGVQSEINNLLSVLKATGTAALSSIQDELREREFERDRLRSQLQEIEADKAPASHLEQQCQKFVESWTNIGELLDSATLEETRVILQHFVEVIQLECTDKEAKRGRYLIKLFPEVGSLDPVPNEYTPTPDGSGNQGVLTKKGLVRQFDKKAPCAIHCSKDLENVRSEIFVML